MIGWIRRIGGFYKGIIINNIGIFIFVGILSVVFNDYGWFPNEDMYAISQLGYHTVLPVLISFEGGKKIGGSSGGIAAALAVCGIAASEAGIGLFSAMLIGPFAGFLWKYSYSWLAGKSRAALQMLIRNLWLGILSGILAAAAYYILAPLMHSFALGLSGFIQLLLDFGLLSTLSIIIEPAKVFFLNNLINHSIFIPLGMSQTAAEGSSVLFLLESNPGPGLGMLAAMLLHYREKRHEYGAAMFTHAIGGLHEIYFPYVLSKPMLLFPLIAGGFAGNLTFQLLDAGLQGPVSPGSVIITLLMAGKSGGPGVLAGIGASALTAFAGSIFVLRYCSKRRAAETAFGLQMPERTSPVESPVVGSQEVGMKVKKIAVICDGGVGTSSMGAAILRRKLQQEKMPTVRVDAYAADLLPDGIDCIVCQKDFYEQVLGNMEPRKLEGKMIYQADSLLSAGSYEELIRQIQERNG